MITWYARNDVPYSGGEKQLSITFPYIKKEHIKVFVNDVETTEYHFLNESQIFLDCELNTGDIMSVRRNTPIDEQMVTFTDTSIVNAEKQNLAQKQLFNTVQEMYDNNEEFKQDTDNVLQENKIELENIIEANKQELINAQEIFKDEVNTKIDMVSSAAEKIEQLEEAVDTAVIAANTAAEQAEIAINKANETTELATQANITIQGTIQDFTENIDAKISTNNENMQSVLAETEAVLQETKDTLTGTLNTTQTTNCLLEVPQRIKLELNNGTLTLKAGSVVTVPNGFEADGTTPKFDYVTIESDVTYTDSGSAGTRLTFYNPTSNTIFRRGATPQSGTSVPNGFNSVYYNTATNTCHNYSNGVQGSRVSFPICICTSNAEATNNIVSIDQVFNGMGYLGSSVWVDKGVKCLIPNGRNEDGSLKNIEHTTPHVAVYANVHAWGGTQTLNITLSETNYLGAQASNRFSQNKEVVQNNTYSYSCEDNYWYYTSNNGSTWNKIYITLLGNITETSSNKSVSDFQIKPAFRAVDYNEAVIKSDLSEAQVVVETYKNGTSWYRVWSDGWCEQGGLVNVAGTGVLTTVQFLKPYLNIPTITTGRVNNSSSSTSVDKFNGVASVTSTHFTICTWTNMPSYWQASDYIW